MDAAPQLTAEEVRKVARLAKLALSEEDVEIERRRLSAVLGHAERLRTLDLENVEPMPHVGDRDTVLRADDPEPEGTGVCLNNDDLMRLAPASMPPFLKVPKVLGDGGGA